MRHWCFVCLLLTLLAASGHFSAQQNDAPWTTYTAQELLVTFEHPPEWHSLLEYGLGVTMSNLPDAKIDDVPAQPGEIEFELLLQSIPSLPEETRPLDMLPEFVDTSDPEVLTLGNDQNAVMVQFSDEDTQTWIVWMTDDGRLSIVHFSTALDETQDFLPDVLRVIDSMRFIDAQTVTDYLESIELEPSILGRTYESESFTFDYPTIWKAEDSTDAPGVILLTQGEYKSVSPAAGDVDIEVRVHADTHLNAPGDVLDRMSPFERTEFYPLVEFSLDSKPALRANLQWGGTRTLFYIVELDTHVYAEIRSRYHPETGNLASIEPLILTMATTMRYSWG